MAREEGNETVGVLSIIPKSLVQIVYPLIAQFEELQAIATRIQSFTGEDANALIAYAYDMAMRKGTTTLHELCRIEQKLKDGEL